MKHRLDLPRDHRLALNAQLMIARCDSLPFQGRGVALASVPRFETLVLVVFQLLTASLSWWRLGLALYGLE